MIKITVPATSANLGSGFDCLGVALTLYNDVYMESDEKITVISSDGADIPLNEDNLIVYSAKKLYEICGVKFKGLYVKQINRVPMARGLGSSSACIVAGLAGANCLLGYPLTTNELIDLAAKTEGHPDNITPAFSGGFTASVFDGDRVYWAKHKIKEKLMFCAVVPDLPFPTESARGILPNTVSGKEAVFNLSHAALLVFSMLQGKYENLKIATDDLLHQPYRLPMIPGAKEIQALCNRLGAEAFYLSGAGSTLMAVVKNEKTLFVENLQKGLYELGLSRYRIIPLYIDNHGVRITEKSKEKQKERTLLWD